MSSHCCLFIVFVFFFLQAVQAAYRDEEIVISSHRLAKDEKGRRIATVKSFEVVEKKSQDLIAKLAEADHAKKSAEFALNVVERQAEGQRVLLCQAEEQLAAYKEQIAALKKKLEETEKARDQAEQNGYDIGVVENEEALRVEVVGVCRHYCF